MQLTWIHVEIFSITFFLTNTHFSSCNWIICCNFYVSFLSRSRNNCRCCQFSGPAFRELGFWVQKNQYVSLSKFSFFSSWSHVGSSLFYLFETSRYHVFPFGAGLTKPGRYTLTLSTMISDSQATDYGGKPLPSFTLNFTIKGEEK